jgi:protein-disulfide isomerase
MKGKGSIAIIVVLLVIGAGAFLMTRPAVEQSAPATQTAAVEATTEDTADMAEIAEIEPAATEEVVASDNTEDATTAEAIPAVTPTETETEAPATEAASSDIPPATETATTENSEGSLLASPKKLTVDVRAAMADRVLGNMDAPVTIIEYASMTCPHCANFHNTMMSEVKRELLATGKARLIFRDYPLDQFALRAAMMARCAPEDKYFDLVEVIFRNQERWTKSENTLKSLAQLGNLAGMDDEFIAACMQNAELESAVLAGLREGQSLYRIKSTPSFVFNTQKNENVKMITGIDNPTEMIETVNKLLNMR